MPTPPPAASVTEARPTAAISDETLLRAALAAAETRAATLEAQLAAAITRAEYRESQLTALVQGLPEGLLLADPTGRIELVNPYFRQLFGLAPGVTLASTAEPMSPDTVTIGPAFRDPAAFATRVWALHQAGQTAVGEEFELADGRTVELDYLVLDHLNAGRLICYRDVTERRRNAAQVQRLTRIPQQNPYPTLCLTPAGELLYANAAGAPVAEALAAAEPGAWVQPLLQLVQQCLLTNQPQRQELALGDYYYLCAAKPVPAENYATVFLFDITARYHAEQQLAEQRAFYETLLEQVPVALGVLDPNHRYVFVNRHAEPDPVARAGYYGLTQQEVSEHRQRPVAIVAQRQHYLEQATAERQVVQWEETFTDGTDQRSLFNSIKPVFEGDGQLRYLIILSIDITELKQAEERIARQRAFYEGILNHLPVQLAVFDADQRFLFVNPAAVASEELRRQMLNTTHYKFLDETERSKEEHQARRQYFERAMHTRQNIQWEEDATTELGQRRLLRGLQAVVGADDSVQLVVGYSLDITERYTAEEEQRRSQALLHTQQKFVRMVVDALPSIIYVIPPEGQVLFRNAAFDAMAASSQHILPAEQQDDAVRQQMSEIAAMRHSVLMSGQPLNTELPLLLSSGLVRHLQVHMQPLPRAEGGHDVLVVSTDITALKEARQAAEENAQAKETFLARMSHEIRTPLNGVLGMAALLRKTPLSPTQQDYLLTMQRSGRHLLALINNVLDLAKITANHLKLDAAPFDVALLLQGAGETVASLAEQKEVELVVGPAPAAGLHLLGDAYRLQQVLLNLLSNAIKFTERGRVDLGVTILSEQAGEVRLRFWVQDTGPGIAPDQQEGIFESFAQAEAATSASFGGTGLGLTISEQLVGQMGGVLRLGSELGVGSTFAFTLALPRVQAPAADAPAPTTYEALRGLRVLLAEDNLVNQVIAQSLLEFWGVEVQVVDNGTEALAQLTTQDFDVALLDIRMPGLSGLETAIALRRHAHPRRANIPIIALTANAFGTDHATYLAAGMNCCIIKPFEEAELCDWLLRLTGRDPAAG